MKKIVLWIAVCMVVFPPAVFAQTPTGDAKPTISSSQKNESLVEQINELKDKIASRVAQLKLVQKHGVVGTVTEASDTRITLTTMTGDVKLIDVDEITKFSSPSAKGTFGISDVTKGSVLSAIGLYNKESKHILARFVSSFTLPVFLTGTISAIDEDGFTITVPNENNINTIIDIERTTKINAYTKDGIAKSGFTKLETGDKVDIVGYASKTEANRITGSYILQLNDLSGASSDATPTTAK